MKLFIWNDPYPKRYGGSCLYVVAPNVDKARKLLRGVPVGCAAFGYSPSPNDYHIVTEDVIKREPDRVLAAPCAEIYEWEE